MQPTLNQDRLARLANVQLETSLEPPPRPIQSQPEDEMSESEKRRHRIYLASSWRNEFQPSVLAALRAAGHEVYDFRNPKPGNVGFSWKQCTTTPPPWSAVETIGVLAGDIAQAWLKLDFDAMKWADTVVMLQPCGRSAALELGWAIGAGKHTLVLMDDGQEPELMIRLADHLAANLDELLVQIAELPPPPSEAILGEPARVPPPLSEPEGSKDDRVMREFERYEAKIEQLEKGIERAWGVIANAGHGWADETGEWCDVARTWRDEYMKPDARSALRSEAPKGEAGPGAVCGEVMQPEIACNRPRGHDGGHQWNESAPAQPQGAGRRCGMFFGGAAHYECDLEPAHPGPHEQFARPTPPPEPRGPQFTEAEMAAVRMVLRIQAATGAATLEKFGPTLDAETRSLLYSAVEACRAALPAHPADGEPSAGAEK
jgi:hypothetical protein